MTWNYRIVHIYHPEIDEHEYSVHEVFYDGDVPEMVTEREVSPYGSTLEELERDMGHYMTAFGKPVLEYDEIGQL